MTDCFSFRVGKEGFSGGGAEWKLNWMAAGFLATWERPDIRARRSFFIFLGGDGGGSMDAARIPQRTWIDEYLDRTP